MTSKIVFTNSVMKERSCTPKQLRSDLAFYLKALDCDQCPLLLITLLLRTVEKWIEYNFKKAYRAIGNVIAHSHNKQFPVYLAFIKSESIFLINQNIRSLLLPLKYYALLNYTILLSTDIAKLWILVLLLLAY